MGRGGGGEGWWERRGSLPFPTPVQAGGEEAVGPARAPTHWFWTASSPVAIYSAPSFTSLCKLSAASSASRALLGVFAGPRPLMPLRKGILGSTSQALGSCTVRAGIITYNPAAPSVAVAKSARVITIATFPSDCSPGLGTVLKATPVLCHLMLTMALWGRSCHCPGCTEGKSDCDKYS